MSENVGECRECRRMLANVENVGECWWMSENVGECRRMSFFWHNVGECQKNPVTIKWLFQTPLSRQFSINPTLSWVFQEFLSRFVQWSCGKLCYLRINSGILRYKLVSYPEYDVPVRRICSTRYRDRYAQSEARTVCSTLSGWSS